MNLSKLFEIQAKLDERIIQEHNLQGQDLLYKKILALQVELGECANEYRGFKFWSKDQRPRRLRATPMEAVDGAIPKGFHVSNPLLEEYVDCLHFILSIGLDLELNNIENWFVNVNVEVFKERKIVTQFIYLIENVGQLYQDEHDYDDLFYAFLGLGEMLGFTWEQIETAYMDKNKVNHERQDNGY